MEATAEKLMIKKHPVYKDSGVYWVGEIPDHWEVKPGFTILEERFEKNLGLKEKTVLSLSYGKIVVKPGEKLTGLVPESFETYQLVYPGDIIIRPTDLQNDKTSLRTGLSKDKGIITSAYINLKVKNGYDTSFIHYFLHAVDITKVIYGLGSGLRQNLNGGDFKRFKFISPPKAEQTAIAQFLDRKTAQIDQAIGIKERQIELLKERRQVLIHQAVTRGLNPDAPMKDSGVEWIGEIPAHWEVRRSKFLFTQRKELARPEDIQLSATQAYGVIPQEEYESKIGRRVVKIQFNLEKRKHVEVNDFVISMRSFQGGLERAWSSGCIRSSYVILKPLEKIDAGFYSYLLKSPNYITALQSTASFIRDGQDLNFDNFSMVDLFILPLDEQKEIASFLDRQLSMIERAIEKEQFQIEKLKEYKASLINSAVTGKIKVC